MNTEQDQTGSDHLPDNFRENIAVVLVGTKHSGNLGSTARVIKNLGFSDLRLVSPACEIINDMSTAMAVNAVDLLENATLFDSLPDAVSDCRIVAGTTGRTGGERRNIINPAEFATLSTDILHLGKLAVVFGREDFGLSNEDLSHCHWIVTLPTPSKFKSFNLSHIVGIICYELARMDFQPTKFRDRASSENLENMFKHLEDVLTEIGFLLEDDPARMMLVIRQMLFRAELDEREVRIVRGMMRQIQWRIQQAGGK